MKLMNPVLPTPPEGNDKPLSHIKLSLERFQIHVGELKMPLLDAVEELKERFPNGSFCLGKFSSEYKDIMDGILDGGLLSSSVGYSLDQICKIIMSGIQNFDKPSSVTIGKLKRMFKYSSRRRHIVSCNPLYLEELSARISSSAKELEPGENFKNLWNEDISYVL